MHAEDSIQQLSETHIQGDPVMWRAVRAHEKDKRAWLNGLPVCPVLEAHRIAHTGVMIARHPHRVVRMQQSGLYFLACLEGEGRVLVDALGDPERHVEDRGPERSSVRSSSTGSGPT